jgi:hypothetical protein
MLVTGGGLPLTGDNVIAIYRKLASSTYATHRRVFGAAFLRVSNIADNPRNLSSREINCDDLALIKDCPLASVFQSNT